MLESEHTFAFARLQDLQSNPVNGIFDLAHLREIHRRTFQDVSSYKGGELRVDGSWNKKRILEGHEQGYTVHYCPNYKEKLNNSFEPLRDVTTWKTLNDLDFSVALANLYSDLDYLHPFNEGNSRALREFTQQFSNYIGRSFRWTPGNTEQTSTDRNILYMARDFLALQKHYPDLSPEEALAKHSRGYESEEFKASINKYLARKCLSDIIFEKVIESKKFSIHNLTTPPPKRLNY
jgi:cell filamentation protein